MGKREDGSAKFLKTDIKLIKEEEEEEEELPNEMKNGEEIQVEVVSEQE